MSISEILEKINHKLVKKGQKLAVALSEGLDSSFAIPLLQYVYNAKGNIEITYRESTYSLVPPEVRSMKSTSFDQRWCAHAAKIRGFPCEILAKRQYTGSKGAVS